MNLDEFAFFNRQLANMLNDGIALAGAIHKLSSAMKRGNLRNELEELHRQIAHGTSLDQALEHSNLPPLYCQMVKIGVRGDKLAEMLSLLADYYQSSNTIATRIKGLIVYPTIVLVFCLIVSVCIARLLVPPIEYLFSNFHNKQVVHSILALKLVWIPPLLILALLIVLVVVSSHGGLQRRLRWRLSPFKENSLMQVASIVAMLLRGGNSLQDALGLVVEMEHETPAGQDLITWQNNLSAGAGDFQQLAAGSTTFPSLFVWIVAGCGEDLTAGFEQAARFYYQRASYRLQMILHGLLPVCTLGLGILLMIQGYMVITGGIIPVFRLLGGSL